MNNPSPKAMANVYRQYSHYTNWVVRGLCAFRGDTAMHYHIRENSQIGVVHEPNS